MVKNYENLIMSKVVKKKEESYNMNELFNRPLIHKQINGDVVYTPLDLERIFGTK
jgi:hypothetical protein